MAKRDIGQEILDGIREVKEYKAGKKVLRVRSLKVPSSPKVIRQRLKLSQSAFASLMGVSCVLSKMSAPTNEVQP
jgi:putative transcriptional regulator